MMVQLPMQVGPGRPAVAVVPLDMSVGEALAFIDGFMHLLADHSQKMAEQREAKNPLRRIILPT